MLTLERSQADYFTRVVDDFVFFEGDHTANVQGNASRIVIGAVVFPEDIAVLRRGYRVVYENNDESTFLEYCVSENDLCATVIQKYILKWDLNLNLIPENSWYTCNASVLGRSPQRPTHDDLEKFTFVEDIKWVRSVKQFAAMTQDRIDELEQHFSDLAYLTGLAIN